MIKNLYYAALIHSGFLVKDPHYFSKNVFSLINTAFEVKEEVAEIQVSEEYLETLEPTAEPASEPTATETPDLEQVVDLDAENVKVVGGNQETPASTE